MITAADDAEVLLYRRLAEIDCSALPRQTVQRCLALVLDQFTCALLALDLPWTAAVRNVADASLPPGSDAARSGAPIYGERRRRHPSTAALVNGTAAHGLDFDDLYFPAMSHPGCVVIPAAIAAAAERGASGADVVAGIVAGYELMGRVGAAVGLESGERGYHATGHQGPLGAAAAVGRVRRLDATAIESAVGVAASMGAGIKAFQEGPGMVKRLHAGRAAEAGVIAVDLVEAGFAGPRRSLTSRFGFVNTYDFAASGGRPDRYRSWAGNDGFVVDDIYIKPYAACGALHGAIAAAESLAERDVDGVDIAVVTVGTSRRALQQNSNARPDGTMAAQYSTEYCVALALLGRGRQARRFLDAGTGADADVLELAAKVHLVIDGYAEQAYPNVNAAVVTVEHRAGRTITARGELSAADSSGWNVAHDKFAAETRELVDPTRGERIAAAVAALVDAESVDDLLDTVHHARRQSHQEVPCAPFSN